MSTTISGTREQAPDAAGEVKGSRLSAMTYEPVLWWGERRGMDERRRQLLARARGDVLEIGTGTGLNARHYPNGLDRLVLAEPEPHMLVASNGACGDLVSTRRSYEPPRSATAAATAAATRYTPSATQSAGPAITNRSVGER